MLVTVTYADGSLGTFGPLDSAAEVRYIMEILAARPDVRSAVSAVPVNKND